jgi:hypothetical protein
MAEGEEVVAKAQRHNLNSHERSSRSDGRERDAELQDEDANLHVRV